MNMAYLKLILAGIGIIITVAMVFTNLIIHTGQYSLNPIEENKAKIYEDIKVITTAGQESINIGVKGLNDIQTNPDKYSDKDIRQGQIEFYRNKILMGVLLTILWIAIFAWMINILFGKFTTSLPVPILLRYGLAVFIVAMLSLVVGKEFPFHGFITLLKNLSVLSVA